MNTKGRVLLLVFLFSFSINTIAQNVIKHTVKKGETVTQIAQKYKVTPYEIYQLNPDVKTGLNENSVVLIPSKSNKNSNVFDKAKETPKPVVTAQALDTHFVNLQDTLYGIAKKYGVSILELENINKEILKEGLKAGQVLAIPFKEKRAVTKRDTTKNNALYHEIQSGETLYFLANKYNTTPKKLAKLNPEISVDDIPLGYKLVVSKNKLSNTPKANYLLEYVVKPQETLFGLSKMFNLEQDQLIALNPELENGVKEGMVLKIPTKFSPSLNKQKELKDLTLSLNPSEQVKELVLLLPFNISNIASDTTLSIKERLKKDSFLNMTLDFYSGSLMAIDSVKKLGLNLNIKIFDTQESKSSSRVEFIIKNNNLKNANVVIGPFYPQYVEQAAQLLNEYNVPVISPLRETTKTYSNLFQSMPQSDYVKTAMLDYIRSKKGNMIALIDKKKLVSRQFFEENHKDVFLASITEKGGYDYEEIRTKFNKEKTNYFILETASTNTILNALSHCDKAKADGYIVELVVLDINDTFETHEIFPKIVKQRILFPSLTNYQETEQSLKFAADYRKINGVFPNQFAIRGFDITFDTLLRMSQTENFVTNAQTIITEGVENKFNYQLSNTEGFVNKGVYIMYYDDEDLTVKHAK